MALLLETAGPGLFLVVLVWTAVLLTLEHRRRAVFYIAFWLIVLSVPWNSYAFEILAVPGLLALAQIALLSMQPQGAKKGPFRLLVVAIILLTFGSMPGTSERFEWIEAAAFATSFVGIIALAASWLLLIGDAWKAGGWWAVGIALPFTAAAVTPVFVLSRPRERWPSLWRFLVWCTVTFGAGFVATMLRADPLVPLGLVLTVLGIAFVAGGLGWLAAIALRTSLARLRHHAAALGTSEAAPTTGYIPRAMGLTTAGVALYIVGVLAFGDFLIDRHPMAGNRSWSQALRGCPWNDQVASFLRRDATRPVVERLATFQFNPPAETSINQRPDLGVALALAKMSVLVYAPTSTVRKVANDWGFSDRQTAIIALGTDRALLLATDSDVLIAFRGTDQTADWRTNLDFLPTALMTEEWMAHGFDQALARLWPDVMAEVNRRRETNPRVWVTGHSLGGALAVLAASRLSAGSQGLPRVAGLYTFGQPRVVSASVGSALAERVPYYRFVMHNDLVWELGAPGTQHSGRQIYFDSFGLMHEASDWTLTLRDTWCTRLGAIEAHGMRMYLGMIDLRSQLERSQSARSE